VKHIAKDRFQIRNPLLYPAELSAQREYRIISDRKQNSGPQWRGRLARPALLPTRPKFPYSWLVWGAATLVTYDESRRPVQASAIFVSLQKGVGAELEKMTSILETKFPHYLF